MEVQFLDNLRRGTSINYADLAPNPVPQGLGDSYRLLCVTSAAVAELENGIRTLQQEVAARRLSAADAEAMVGQVNPPVFREAQVGLRQPWRAHGWGSLPSSLAGTSESSKFWSQASLVVCASKPRWPHLCATLAPPAPPPLLQYADGDQLEAMQEGVGLLKKVCRQKAVALLKDVRVQMEESRGGRLRRNAEALAYDLAFAEENKRHLEGVAAAAAQYVAEQQRRMAEEGAARAAEGERRRAVAGMREEIAGLRAANEARRAALAEAQARVASLAAAAGEVQREKGGLRMRADGLQVTLQQSQGQGQLARDASPAAVLRKVRAGGGQRVGPSQWCLPWVLVGKARKVPGSCACVSGLRQVVWTGGLGRAAPTGPEPHTAADALLMPCVPCL